MSTAGERLRDYLESQMMAKGSKRRGWVKDLERLTGIKRGTMATWWNGSSEPGMESFQVLADGLGVSRVALIAVFDGVGPIVPVESPVTKDVLRATLLELLQDPETRATLRVILREPPQMPPEGPGAA